MPSSTSHQSANVHSESANSPCIRSPIPRFCCVALPEKWKTSLFGSYSSDHLVANSLTSPSFRWPSCHHTARQNTLSPEMGRINPPLHSIAFWSARRNDRSHQENPYASNRYSLKLLPFPHPFSSLPCNLQLRRSSPPSLSALPTTKKNTGLSSIKKG